MTQKFLCWLFSIVYRQWLYDPRDSNYYKSKYSTVEWVYSWRSARISRLSKSGYRCNVQWLQPCFWWFQ